MENGLVSSSKTYTSYMKAYNEFYEDIPRRVPNTNKIEKAINWVPKISLSQALDIMIQY
jgi:nucleoside-diphosphate-sugar epimerase